MEKVLLECPKQVLAKLCSTKAKMKTTGERVIYSHSLKITEEIPIPNYEVWSIYNQQSISFLAEVMQKTTKEAENFLRIMREELPNQAEEMFTVYKLNNEPVGIVLPHIEPHTDNEGRIFWLGMHPNYLGKGLGGNLHKIGLYRLKDDFYANRYVGITKLDNKPMRKIMLSNGCMENENRLVSLEYKSLVVN